MNEILDELKYVTSHEWVKMEDDDIAIIGITPHAAKLLGDLVFVDLPEIGTEFSAGDECGVVESVKAASDIYSPLSGEVIEVNEELADTPELINESPYQDGWIFKLRLSNPERELADLLDASDYEDFLRNNDD
jgi:glycine cleavage system H protein